MRFIIPIGILGAILFFVFGQNKMSEGDLKVTNLDLQKVLDITVPVIVRNAKESSLLTPKTDEEKEKFSSLYFMKTAMDLAKVYNSSNPKIYEDNLDVYPANTGALVAYEDINKNRVQDESEKNIFFIEVDGENSRIIATSRIGASDNAGFPAGALLGGYFLGRMLTMQSNFPNTKSRVNNSQKTSPKQAMSNAKARAGSGSHRAGK